MNTTDETPAADSGSDGNVWLGVSEYHERLTEEAMKDVENGASGELLMTEATVLMFDVRRLRAKIEADKTLTNGDTVRIPTSVSEAALMVRLGTQYLRDHAPERLAAEAPNVERNRRENQGGCSAGHTWKDEAMANNRMFLVYRPTGDAVYLGKRMGWGWYGTPDDVAHHIAELFEKAEKDAGESDFSQDDFAIALEIGENQPHAIDKWQYKDVENGKVRSLAIDDSVPYGKPESI